MNEAAVEGMDEGMNRWEERSDERINPCAAANGDCEEKASRNWENFAARNSHSTLTKFQCSVHSAAKPGVWRQDEAEIEHQDEAGQLFYINKQRKKPRRMPRRQWLSEVAKQRSNSGASATTTTG